MSVLHKTNACFGFCHQLFLQLLRVKGKKNKKAWFWDNFLHFQIFLNFVNLGLNFGIDLKNHFRQINNTFGVTLLF